MKLNIEINEDEIVRLAVDKIAENLVKKIHRGEPRHGVRNTRGHKISSYQHGLREQGRNNRKR